MMASEIVLCVFGDLLALTEFCVVGKEEWLMGIAGWNNGVIILALLVLVIMCRGVGEDSSGTCWVYIT